MKRSDYELPVMEIILVEDEDVVTSSPGINLPYDPLNP